MLALDKGENVFLIFLDLLAAFDMVNHSLLFSRLQQRCGTCGTVLNRFESYLTQFVKINESYASKHVLSVGVLQGPVLEPVLYLLYTSPISDVTRSYNYIFSYHLYADDTQLYIAMPMSQFIQQDKLKLM